MNQDGMLQNGFVSHFANGPNSIWPINPPFGNLAGNAFLLHNTENLIVTKPSCNCCLKRGYSK